MIESAKSNYTTYVFNNKSDTTKYNVPGTYVAYNTDDAIVNKTYWCKSYDVTGEFTSKEVTDSAGNTYTAYTVTSAKYSGTETQVKTTDNVNVSTTGATVINNCLYYVDENGEIYTIVYKNNGTEVHEGFDFCDTTVAFAVVWKPRLETDTIVIDYGLDVSVDVIANDNLAAGLVGVRSTAPDGVKINEGTYTSAKNTTADVYLGGDTSGVKIGTAMVESGTNIRFSLNRDSGMQMNKAAIFYYEADVNYYKGDVLQTTSMYSSVIIIPATTVYYEDEYVTLKTFTKQTDDSYKETAGWIVNSSVITATQDVDRPGEDMISESYDANNLYGYDSAYETISKYSMESAAKTTVNEEKYATAEFIFYGTGFDIISMTDTTTGTILVDIYTTTDGGTTWTLSNDYYAMVDTYYGYAYNADTGEWTTVDSNDPNALYQVPVIKMENMPYAQYKAVITVSYMSFMDHNTAEAGYDFYLDAIRIYDPVAPGTVVGKDGESSNAQNITIEDIYAADGEGWPVYQELRNNVIAAADFTSKEINGVVFVDSNSKTYSVSDYISYGPNNELYLAPGQMVIFSLNLADKIASVQLGMKAVDEDGASYAILDGATIADSDDLTGAAATKLSTTTDMYYDITDFKDKVIVIYNAGTSGVLSLTNIKTTFTEDPGSVAGLYYVDYDVISAVLAATNTEPAFEPDVWVKVSSETVKNGGSVTVTVTTSNNVETVSIDGSLVATYTVDSNQYRVWTAEVDAGTSAGTKEISVIAYNAGGVASEAETVSITVDAPTAEEVVKEAVKTTIKKLWNNFKTWFSKWV